MAMIDGDAFRAMLQDESFKNINESVSHSRTNAPQTIVARSQLKAVFVLTPFNSSDVSIGTQLQKYSNRALLSSLHANEAPISSHSMYYSQNPTASNYGVINGKPTTQQHTLALSVQTSWLLKCDVLAVYDDYGITSDMESIISIAKTKGKQIQHRRIGAHD